MGEDQHYKLDLYNIKPSYKVYEIWDYDLQHIFEDMIEKATGVSIDLGVDFDDETFSLYVYGSDIEAELDLPEEDFKKVYSYLPHPDEEYMNANFLIGQLFGIVDDHVRVWCEPQEHTTSFLVYVEIPIERNEV